MNVGPTGDKLAYLTEIVFIFCTGSPLVWTCVENLAPNGIRSRTVKSVASRCTD